MPSTINKFYIKRKEEEKDRKRKLIKKTVLVIIQKEGINKVNIRNITNKIKWSLPVFYSIFGSKEILMNDVEIKEACINWLNNQAKIKGINILEQMYQTLITN